MHKNYSTFWIFFFPVFFFFSIFWIFFFLLFRNSLCFLFLFEYFFSTFFFFFYFFFPTFVFFFNLYFFIGFECIWFLSVSNGYYILFFFVFFLFLLTLVANLCLLNICFGVLVVKVFCFVFVWYVFSVSLQKYFDLKSKQKTWMQSIFTWYKFKTKLMLEYVLHSLLFCFACFFFFFFFFFLKTY